MWKREPQDEKMGMQTRNRMEQDSTIQQDSRMKWGTEGTWNSRMRRWCCCKCRQNNSSDSLMTRDKIGRRGR